ncbi:MAG: hypothetical protein RL095_1451 [Verrucomicrobiota bacterium]|jgi:PAS domain S-box-containing protein
MDSGSESLPSAGDWLTLQMALDSHALVSITDPQGRITYVNEMFCQLSKYSREELIGADHRIINSHHHPPEFFRDLWATIASGGIWKGEICNRAKDGSLYWVSSSIVPFHDSQGKISHYISVRTDISQQKRLAEEVDAAIKQKSQFIATMSHEIRTPMNGIIGLAELLKRTRLDLQQQEYVDSMITCGQSLIALVNDILDVAKIESGRISLEEVDFSMQELLEDSLTIFVDSAEAKGLRLNYEIPREMPVRLRGDPARLVQILTNLVGNAIKFTEVGKVDIRISVLKLFSGRVRFRLAVADTGIGMSAAQLGRIGEAFVQADSSTTRRFGGTGLGLYICRALVRLMQGSFAVSSREGEGSVFSFELELPIGEDDPWDLYSIIDGKRLVAAVSDASLIHRLEKLCGRWKMRLECFPQAAELVQGLRREGSPPDLLLIDEDLPGINGVLLVKMLRREHAWAAVPMIFTSPAPDRIRNKFEQISILLVQGRPLRPGSLLQALKQIYLGGKSPEESKPRRRLSRVLVAEDNPVNQMLIEAFLRDYAETVDLAGNGKEAVAFCETAPYEAIFMDCQMPVMDGYEATRQIRSLESKLQRTRAPIIAITANAMPGDREQCLAAGMDEHICKPLTGKILQNLFQRLFDLFPGASSSPEMTGGEDLSRQALMTFREEAEKASDSFERGDLKAVAASAHKLKSSSAWLEFGELARLSKDLELAAKAGGRSVVATLLPQWVAAVNSACVELKTRLS